MSGSCCDETGKAECAKVTAAPQGLETTTEKNGTRIQTSECCSKSARGEKVGVRRLPIVWQRLVGADGATCRRCDATHQHLLSAITKLSEVLKRLKVELTLEVRELSEASFKNEPGQSNRIWIADKPIEDWLGASVGSSPCCSVCGDVPCRTVEVEGAVFEDIPEAMILQAALMAASGLVGRAA